MNDLPEYAYGIIDTLAGAGFEAYAVGGCVRDALMGIRPHDIDITTSAAPDEISSLFEKNAYTGKKYGTVTVFTDGGQAEITTFRTENGYSDFRRPDTVSFTTNINDDLKRRDFTVNSICLNRNGLLDPFGGEADISARLIRCVGDPEERFREDALRILRAFRFAATLGFGIEKNTLDAALANAVLLERISAERIRDELVKLAMSPSPQSVSPLLGGGHMGFLSLHDSPLLDRLSLLPAEPIIRLSGLFLLCGKDSADRLALSNSMKSAVKSCISIAESFPPPDRISIKQTLRRYPSESYTVACALRKALYDEDTESHIGVYNDIIEKNEPYLISHLAVRGKDLLDMGVPPADIGTRLDSLLDEVIRNPEANEKSVLLRIPKQ